MRRRTVLIVAIAAAIAGILLWTDFRYLKLSPETIRSWMLSFGWIAPAIYIGLFLVRPFTLFPASILTLAGGLAFGTWLGMLYTVLGELPGAVLAFLLARRVGLGFFRGRDDPRLHKLERAMQRRGFPMVLLLRLAPFVPFDLVSYAAGAARIPMRAYLPATLIGALPGTFAYCFLGASLTRGSWKQIALAGIVFAVAMSVPLLYRKKVEREVEEPNAASDGDTRVVRGPGLRRKAGARS
ncbi:TVP38/TMEM64 family protein [Cohnella nanjingensis]|uniref:TVP38/TMEM64 family membrane protein n=1 Tax=Cohnella nanjingensis TaxID=1387779 RepID=A0A7X0VGK9_9BACL|nr:TVP38/TMEM64 family protein [Cohnella nanjingensis]MBB6671769.1 TVP38/TMEM64 family protein [Cohnella nanjingensis]